MRVYILTAFLAFAAQAVAQVPKDTVLTERRALVLGEPRVAVAQNVRIVSASPSGRYLLVLRERPDTDSVVLVPPRGPMPKTVHVVLWDSVTEQSRELAVLNGVVIHEWKEQFGSNFHERITQIRWLTGIDKAVLSVNSVQRDARTGIEANRREAYFVDAPNSSLKRIYSEPQSPIIDCTFSVSPISPVAVKTVNLTSESSAEVKATLQVLDSNGSWGPEVRLPSTVSFPGESSWSEDGRLFQIAVRYRREGERFSSRVLRFDPTTRDYELAIGAFASYQVEAVTSDARLVNTQAMNEEIEDSAPVAWWLESTIATERPKRMVTPSATRALLPNRERFVAFVSNGVLFTRKIAEFSLAQYGKWRDEDIKQDAIARADRIASGFLAFARKNDGAILSSGGYESAILEYLVGPEDFKGFTLVTRATNLSQIADRKSTVLGYVETPVGRAVIYADQHSEWKESGGG